MELNASTGVGVGVGKLTPCPSAIYKRLLRHRPAHTARAGHRKSADRPAPTLPACRPTTHSTMAPTTILTALCVLHVAVAALAVSADTPKHSNNDQLVMDTSGMPNSYKFYYDAKDGSSRFEQGNMLDAGTDKASLDVHGAVSWLDDRGHMYQMTYKAGKRGYRTIIKKIS